jgi:hypothetical protein
LFVGASVKAAWGIQDLSCLYYYLAVWSYISCYCLPYQYILFNYAD